VASLFADDARAAAAFLLCWLHSSVQSAAHLVMAHGAKGRQSVSALRLRCCWGHVNRRGESERVRNPLCWQTWAVSWVCLEASEREIDGGAFSVDIFLLIAANAGAHHQ
jgi:hypothetical protein